MSHIIMHLFINKKFWLHHSKASGQIFMKCGRSIWDGFTRWYSGNSLERLSLTEIEYIHQDSRNEGTTLGDFSGAVCLPYDGFRCEFHIDRCLGRTAFKSPRCFAAQLLLVQTARDEGRPVCVRVGEDHGLWSLTRFKTQFHQLPAVWS